MTNKNPLQIKRGKKADLPMLHEGEPAFCLDTEELYVGSPSGNILINGGTDRIKVFEKTIATSEWIQRPMSDLFECECVHDLNSFDLDIIAKDVQTNENLFIAWSLVSENRVEFVADENIDTKVVIKVIK